MNKKMRRVGAILATAAWFTGALAETQMTGEEIWQLEQALYKLGYHSAECDMRLDDETQRAIRNFQIANNLEVTGEPDEETVKKINSDKAISEADYLAALAEKTAESRELKLGSSGSSVSALQKKLKTLGYYSGGSDGEFGEGTRAAVVRFQMANGLNQTGIVDASTKLRLEDESPISFSAFLELSCASFGQSGAAVHAIQKRLLALGYYDGACTGSYGDATQKAVSQFQRFNELEENGNVDAATCEKLYSDMAIALRVSGTLHSGDTGDDVKKLNAELSDLGYPANAESEKYAASTETSVRLFQMANGLPTTGDADPETISRLEGGQAIGMERVKDSFSQQVRVQNDSALALLSSIASKQRGKAFDGADPENYSGYAFVQYVCVSAGVPVTDASELNALIAEPVEDVSTLQAGEIIAFYPSGDTTLPRKMGVYTGSWHMICATEEDPWVLECDIVENGGTLCRWAMVEG